MNDLPVLRLTQLLTPEEIKIVQGVKRTLEVGFCPVGVCMPDESYALHGCLDSERGDHCEERYTPLSYYALSVWRETVKRLEAMPEFADALEVEWYPVAATFRSIRYIHDKRQQYIQTFWEIAAEIADKQNIKIHYGRFDKTSEYPGEPLHTTYIMPQELFMSKRSYGMKDGDADFPRDEVFSYSWNEIKDFFVELSLQQLAFNAGDLMNNLGSELDQKFIDACAKKDLPLMKKLLAQGANIHAVDAGGDMAAQSLVWHFYDEFYYAVENKAGDEREQLQEKIYQQTISALKWLIQQGYDLNICAYDEATALYHSIDNSPGIRLMKFLLKNGADPNIDCYINNHGGDTTCALVNVWDNYHIWDESDFPQLDEMEKLLKKYGAE